MARSDKNRDAALRVAVRKVKRALKRRIALRRRRRSPAKFVGVTGSSAKSTTVTLLSHVLASQGPTRMQVFYNSYFPVLESMLQLKGDEAFSVNELGAGTEGFGAAAQMIGPDLAIVTMISMEHRSIYKTEDNITREKAQLVEALRPGGIALLNGDDPQAMTMAETAEGRQARVVTFGQGDGVSYRATRIHAAWPNRLSLSLEWAGGTLDLKTQFVGSHFWLPVTAAAAAALELGVPPEVVAKRIAGVKPLQSRCDTLQIDGGPNFILDTAKAPARTLSLTLDMLRDARAPFKRFILYGVSDFGGNNRKQYSQIYSAAREVADEVIILGDRKASSKLLRDDRGRSRAEEWIEHEIPGIGTRQDQLRNELLRFLSRVIRVFRHGPEGNGDIGPEVGRMGQTIPASLRRFPVLWPTVVVGVGSKYATFQFDGVNVEGVVV